MATVVPYLMFLSPSVPQSDFSCTLLTFILLQHRVVRVSFLSKTPSRSTEKVQAPGCDLEDLRNMPSI